MGAGVTAAPLNPAATSAELADQIATLGLVAVVADEVDATLEAAAASAGANVWRGEQGQLRLVAPGQGRPRRLPGEGAALVLASSGTTGEPKITPLTEGRSLFTARGVTAHHELTADDCCYSPLPLFHINALVVGAVSTLVAGSRLVLDRRFSAHSFWQVAAEQQVTWLNLVPAIIGVLAGVSPPPPEVAGRIGFARSASAPLPAATRERFEAHTGIAVLETYGMTEAASQIAANPRRQADRQPGSVGRPVGLELRVVERSGHTVAPGTVGEVQIRGFSVAHALLGSCRRVARHPTSHRSRGLVDHRRSRLRGRRRLRIPGGSSRRCHQPRRGEGVPPAKSRRCSSESPSSRLPRSWGERTPPSAKSRWRSSPPLPARGRRRSRRSPRAPLRPRAQPLSPPHVHPSCGSSTHGAYRKGTGRRASPGLGDAVDAVTVASGR